MKSDSGAHPRVTTPIQKKNPQVFKNTRGKKKNEFELVEVPSYNLTSPPHPHPPPSHLPPTQCDFFVLTTLSKRRQYKRSFFFLEKKKNAYSGAHSRVATLIQPSFQKNANKTGGGKCERDKVGEKKMHFFFSF